MTQPMEDAIPVAAAPPIVHWEAPEPLIGPAPGYQFAGHGSRFVAYILDCVLIYVLVFVPALALIVIGSAFATDVTRPQGPSSDASWSIALTVFVVLVFVVVIGYFPFFWARSGQTPGMKPFGLWVVRDQDGGPLRTRTAILRLIGLYVASSVFYLGFIWIFIDKRRRGWHDLIAGTVVVHRMKGRSST